MATEIKPIETFYNGYRFRSRLEARWAVFFDAAGIKYEYEPEGFTNGEQYYLPDFYFPDHNLYGEVKGDIDQYNKDINKIISMITDTSKIKKIMIFGHIPKTKADVVFLPILYYSVFRDDVSFCYKPIQCFENEAKILVQWMSPSWAKTEFNLQNREVNLPMEPLTIESLEEDIKKTIMERGNPKSINGKEISLIEMENYIGYFDQYSSKLNMLFDKTRQARFEHGECG